MKTVSRSKVLITGLSGFTGKHLKPFLTHLGFDVVGLKCNLLDREAVFSEVRTHSPDYVIHLAGISFAAELDAGLIYSVNVIGSTNLLDVLSQLKTPVKKILIASSATVYGNTENAVISESLCPKPVSHYGCSKLSMEFLVQNYSSVLPIIITRPFNYTGVGHSERFLIPKIVKAYQENRKEIELGNLEVSREFNDVRDICHIYYDLLMLEQDGLTVNVCSGKTVSLNNLIGLMDEISGFNMGVSVNPLFVRSNEIKDLSGDPTILYDLVSPVFKYNIEDTLRWMYKSQ